MSKILPFNGKTIVPLDPDHVLECAKGKIQDLIIIGREPNGEYYFASSFCSISEHLLLLERFKQAILKEGVDE